MKIYHCIADFKPVHNPVVTIGTFDGAHLGHRAIFERMKEEAQKLDGETVVITFYPHPRIVLEPENTELRFIKTQERKIHEIEQAGIDHLIVVEFTREFAATSSEDFIRKLVVEKIKPRALIIGYDHHFGKDRSGGIQLLENLGREFGFDVDMVEAQSINGTTVSSTKIRNLLKEGGVREANQLLGHEYSITGTVVKGKSIGRDLGFPTANIKVADHFKLIAAVGVYACRVIHKNVVYKGMSNIGFRPTVDHGELTIEVNIFDFDQDLYGQEITISFVDRMRDEKKFESLDALKIQLAKDKIKAMTLL
ncbi:MAG: riboflavin biosynthesis protein RibF [Bacteroidetes bacterium GWF2_41_31]|nr:MAG: riboflavin biosynthesis protein RibF [Bacteroidetes bacterium GWF2_41_31]